MLINSEAKVPEELGKGVDFETESSARDGRPQPLDCHQVSGAPASAIIS
jgi:hypothetical protein